MRYAPDSLLSLYCRAPVWAQTFFTTAYGIRKRRVEQSALFRSYLAFLEGFQWRSRADQEAHQLAKLQELLLHAQARVPYYQRVFAEYGIAPSQVTAFADLKRIPLLNKETVRSHARELIATGNIGPMAHASTSGTTGSPLTMYWDLNTLAMTRAVEWRLHRRAGYLHQTWAGYLAGHRVVPLDVDEPPFGRRDHINKMAYFSSFHLSAKNTSYYASELKKDIRFLLGYPSSLAVLALFMKEQGMKAPMEAVFVSSEPLYPWQKEVIELVFGPVFDYYGQTERVASASSCGVEEALHIDTEACVVEIVKEEEGQASIVGTCLTNYGMPLIRYDIGDISDVVDAACSCGRHSPRIAPVDTKREDMILTPEGHVISASLLTFALKTPKGVKEAQIVQDDVDHLRVRVVPSADFTKEAMQTIVSKIQELVGASMNVTCEMVDAIPRTQSGKFRFVVSEVPIRIGSRWVSCAELNSAATSR